MKRTASNSDALAIVSEAANPRRTPVRAALVQRIRRELAENRYLSDQRLAVAIDRLVDTILAAPIDATQRRVGA